jgi:heptosyltransferase-2
LKIVDPQKIIIRTPNWLGDLIMAILAFKAIRERFKNAEITLLIKKPLGKTFHNSSFYNNVIEFDPKNTHKGIKGWMRLVRKLRKENFDLGILFPKSFSSALIFFLSGIKIRWGYNCNARGFLLSKKIPLPKKIIPMVDLYLNLVEELTGKQDVKSFNLTSCHEEKERLNNIFFKHNINNEKIISIIPGASFGPSKCWKEENFATLADYLIKQFKSQILILPGPGEEEIAWKITEKMENKSVVLSDPPLPIDLLKVAIERSWLIISNDTGPRHIATAYEKPVVVIMGSTDPQYTDYEYDKKLIIRKELECSPCHLKICPKEHECMELITPEEVFDKIKDFVGEF